MEKFSLGIDIGGTKIAAALVNEKGEIFFRKQYASNANTAEDFFEIILKCINEVLIAGGQTIDSIRGIGIGLPGKVDIINGIAVAQNNVPLRNFPIVERLKSYFGHNLKIVIDNDVKMAAFAEYRDASMDSDEIFTYVTISTGIAAASIINEKAIRGEGFSGEIGFQPILRNGEYLTLENVSSGPAIERKARVELNNKNLRTKDVFKLADEGNPVAQNIINTSARSISLALYSLISVLNPKRIVLGGSVAYNNPSFKDLIIKYLADFLVNEQIDILDNLLISRLGSDNGIIGAGLSAYKL